MPRSLDLLDGPEAGCLDQRGVAGRRLDLRIAGNDVDAGGGQVIRGGPEPARRLLHRLAGTDRAAREVRARATDERPRPLEREEPKPVVEDEEARSPAMPLAVARPGERLVDVAAGHFDRSRVPTLELPGRRLVDGHDQRPSPGAAGSLDEGSGSPGPEGPPAGGASLSQV